VTLAPILLPANQPADRFYRGGPRIAAFRGERGRPAAGDHVPEDWVASVTTQAGEASIGLTRLPDPASANGGRLLRDAIAADPIAWLGPAHLEAFGADPRLLVKLLDPGQRLPVHAHPDDAWAAEHLGHAHGKAEAWHILAAGEVFLGLRLPVTRERLLELVAYQDTEALLGLLHRREVVPGDTVYVPPGVLHAIGEGVLLAEVQQPEDLSILIEWRGFDIDGTADGHLGVGFDVAVGALELTARTDEALDALITRAGALAGEQANGSVLAPAAAPYFRAERYAFSGRQNLEKGYAVLVIVEGAVELGYVGRRLPTLAGDTVLVPYAAGPLELTGSATVLVFRPPAPTRAAPAASRRAEHA
jgi:mannose-6-phosphate isomerase